MGNIKNLIDSSDVVLKKVMRMYTDPTRVRATDPGHTENNPLFIYLNAFHNDKKEIEEFEGRYRLGKVGDIEVKKRLAEILNNFLEPIRQKKKEFSRATGRRGRFISGIMSGLLKIGFRFKMSTNNLS